MSNRLALEKSPYLLQHAHNPVDWYAWGPQAFEKAAQENKPVFLSIGYSTCHWCHVMERESFEDLKTAEILNAHFVAIKVDREERPDLDGVYMNYVIATSGHGGWPMSVFLTPDKKPFYGGTYFPPEDRYGIPGFKTLLLSIAEAWRERKHEILHSAESAVSFLNQGSVSAGQKTLLDTSVLKKAFEHFDSVFDAQNGGFGRAPKFPSSHTLSFLLRYFKRAKSDRALEMVNTTLKAMADGGIYDQLGGGFHRYSTDNAWRIPHFEKMLYDQALLVKTYLEAYEATKNPEYARIARETLDYVLKEMTGPEGGFYSAQDADSFESRNSKEKKEGAFFLWKKEEVEKLLGTARAAAFIDDYGIRESGNAIQDPHHEFENKNVLYRAQPASFDNKAMAESRKILLQARETRPRPYRDDKILSDWNGLMITSFALASRILGEPRYAEAAGKAAGFISEKLKDAHGRLLHRYRDGEAAIAGNLNDHAFMAEAYLSLYGAARDPKWLDLAKKTARHMIDFFWDETRGGFYLTAHDAEALITRPKEVYDGALPSGNSVAAWTLLKLHRESGELLWSDYAGRLFNAFSGELSEGPANFTRLLTALDAAIGPTKVCLDDSCALEE